MDPRTRFILYQMLNRGQLTEINGCVSTGKEVAPAVLDVMCRPTCIMRAGLRELSSR